MSYAQAWQDVRPVFDPYMSGSLPNDIDDDRPSFISINHAPSARSKLTAMFYTVPEANEIEVDRILAEHEARKFSLGLVAFSLVASLANQAGHGLLTLKSGFSIGTYVWGLCGADTDRDKKPVDDQILRRAMLKRLAQLKSVLPTEICNDLSKMLCSPNTDIHTILAYPYQLPTMYADKMTTLEVRYLLRQYADNKDGTFPIGLALSAYTQSRMVFDTSSDQAKGRLLSRLERRKPCLARQMTRHLA